ncbi:unnamed protein product, partial [Ixodes pacificus]
GEFRPQSPATVPEQTPGQTHVPPDAPPGKRSVQSPWSPSSARIRGRRVSGAAAEAFRPRSVNWQKFLHDSSFDERSRRAAAKSEPRHTPRPLRHQDIRRLLQRRGIENSRRPFRKAFPQRGQPRAPLPELIKKQGQARRSYRGSSSEPDDGVLSSFREVTPIGRAAAGQRRSAHNGETPSRKRVPRRAASDSAVSSMASTRGTAAASGFVPITGPFGSQEMAYSPFLDGGSLFASAISGYPSMSRQYSKQSHGDLEYGRSASSFPSEGYGSLGSGNFQLIRGGIYADNQASSSHVPYYVQGPSRGYGGAFSYDEDSEPVMGFQGFEHFGNPLHNALSKQSHVIGASSAHPTRSAHAKAVDPLTAAS